MFFNKKKNADLDALMSATENLRNFFEAKLGDGWHFDIDKAFPCRLSVNAEDCGSGWHPAVLIVPKDQILQEEFRLNENGLSTSEGPRMAVFYGCDSGGKAPYTFFLHDIQATASPFNALKWMVAVPNDPMVESKSIAKVLTHFESFLR